uniref:Ig-like domain-containing protein n=1 Tax=Tetranychus urticae TaxID=32264 RepID=T1K6I8_TETUR
MFISSFVIPTINQYSIPRLLNKHNKNEPDSSSNQDIKVEYVIGEEVKLACLLESRDSNEVIWMKDNLTISSQPSAELVSDTEYQIFHNSINSFIILNVLKITINSANASGLYTCAIKSNSSTEQGESMSFQVIATSSREYAEYKFKRPNITGFIVGMIPSIMLFFYIIMSLGYRSRYAMEQEEEEEGLGI